MRYSIGDGLILNIEDGVVSTLRQHSTIARKEAGGILLGRVCTDEVMIERITTPSWRDRAARFWFVRDVRTAQERVTAAWRESAGTMIYLGEWHTHPEPDPTPSPTDRALVENMLRNSKMEIDFLFLVVAGTQSLWVGMQASGALRELRAMDQP